jgi:hypothetical protein
MIEMDRGGNKRLRIEVPTGHYTMDDHILRVAKTMVDDESEGLFVFIGVC